MKITYDMLEDWGRCASEDGEKYSKENVLKLTSGRAELTALECLDLDIPDEDKVWLVLRPEILGQDKYEQYGYEVATQAVKRHCLHCGIPKVEEWAKKWISGEDRTIFASVDAGVDAGVDARAARGAGAAYAAAGADAEVAAAEDARAATYAASAAAYTAGGAAARTEERKYQVKLLREYLKTGG